MMALVPYIVVIVVFSLAKLLGPLKTFAGRHRHQVRLARAGRQHPQRRRQADLVDHLQLPVASSPGSLLVLCGILIAISTA